MRLKAHKHLSLAIACRGFRRDENIINLSPLGTSTLEQQGAKHTKHDCLSIYAEVPLPARCSEHLFGLVQGYLGHLLIGCSKLCSLYFNLCTSHLDSVGVEPRNRSIGWAFRMEVQRRRDYHPVSRSPTMSVTELS